MSETQGEPSGPDLTLGVAADSLADGQMLAGHVGDDAVLVARHGSEYFAIGATCTHYGGPLAEGLIVGEDPVLDAKRFRLSEKGICLITQPMIDKLSA